MKREFSDELISAYLDGELTSAEQAEVEAALRSHGELRQMVEDFQRLREELERLPRQQLDDDFAERVLRRTERTLAMGDVGLAGELGANDRTAGDRAAGVSPFRIVPATGLNSSPHGELVPARLLLAQQTVTRRWQLLCACTASAMLLMIIGIFTFAATNSFSPLTAFHGADSMSAESQFVSSPAGLPAPPTNHFDSLTFVPTSEDSGASERPGASELRDRSEYALQVEMKRDGTSELAKQKAESLHEPELPLGMPSVPDMPGGVGGPGRKSLARPANGIDGVIDGVDRKGLGGGGGGAGGRGVAPSGRRLSEGMGSGGGRSDDSGDLGPGGGGNRTGMGGMGGFGGAMGGLGGAMGGAGGAMGGAGAKPERAAGSQNRPTDKSEEKERLRMNSETRNDRFGVDPSPPADTAKSATAPVPPSAGLEKMQRGADSSRDRPRAGGAPATGKAARSNLTPERPKSEPELAPAPASGPSSQPSEPRPESRPGVPGARPTENASQPARGEVDAKMKPIAPDGTAPGGTSGTAEPFIKRGSIGQPNAAAQSEPGKPGEAAPAKLANDTAPGERELGQNTRRTDQSDKEQSQPLTLWDFESVASQPIVVLNLRLTEGENSLNLVDEAIRECGIDVTQLSAELPQLLSDVKLSDQQRLAKQSEQEQPKPGDPNLGQPKPGQPGQKQPGNRPGDVQLLIGQANQSQILKMVTQLGNAAGVTVEPTLAKLSSPQFKQNRLAGVVADKSWNENEARAYRFVIPSVEHSQAVRKDAAGANERNIALFRQVLSREAPGAKDEGRHAGGQPNTEPEKTDPNKGKPNTAGKPAGNEPAAGGKPNDEPGQRLALFVFVQVVPAKSATIDEAKPSESSNQK